MLAYSLHNSYRLNGHNSWMAVGHKKSNDAAVYTIDNDKFKKFWTRFFFKIGSYLEPHTELSNCYNKLNKYITYHIGQPRKFIKDKLGLDNFNFPASKEILNLNTLIPDIIHFHNLHGQYFDLNYLNYLSKINPVVLTLHDTWLFTGHCANFIDCNRWTMGCGKCPDLSLHPPIERDATSYNLKRKSKIYNQSKIYLTAPSRWLLEKVNKSILSPSIIESRVIHNGVDRSLFCSYDRLKAREELNLPLDSKIILHVSKGFINNPYKGHETFLSSVYRMSDKIKDKSVIFLAVGDSGDSFKLGNISAKYVGYIDDQKVMARYYQASDVYLHPSRGDNFPNAVLEALACGVPVVATAVGGIVEQIVHDTNGYLVPRDDFVGIANYINKIISDPDLHSRLSDNCVKTFSHKYTLEYMVKEFLEFYEYILDTRNKLS